MKKLPWMNLLLWAVWDIVWLPLAHLGPKTAGSRSYLFVAIAPPVFAYALNQASRSATTTNNHKDCVDRTPKASGSPGSAGTKGAIPTKHTPEHAEGERLSGGGPLCWCDNEGVLTERGLFDIRWPTSRREHREGPKMDQLPGPVAGQATILVVDDDAGILGFVVALLVEGGHFVLKASSGSAALQQAKDYPGKIDLLLSDFQMSG